MQQLLDDYLSGDELAAQLGRSLRTIQRWDRLRIGPVPTIIGNRKVFRMADIQVWLDAQRRGSRPERTRQRLTPTRRKTDRR